MSANVSTTAQDDHTAAASLAAVPTPSARTALGETSWLGGVPTATLDRLADLAVLHRVPAGSTLFEQAETPSFAHFLVSGSVALIGTNGPAESLIELVRPVDLLLPAAVLNRQPFLARGRVLDEAHLVLIQADAFRDAIATDHALCLAVLGCQAAQFRRQIKLAKNLKLRSAEERVGCYLLQLVQDTPANAPIRLPMEKRLIAWQLGMTRETFSRILASMERYHLHISGEVIEVADPTPLRTRFRLDPQIDGPEPVVSLTPRQH